MGAGSQRKKKGVGEFLCKSHSLISPQLVPTMKEVLSPGSSKSGALLGAKVMLAEIRAEDKQAGDIILQQATHSKSLRTEEPALAVASL